MSKERFVACYMADQDARQAARADSAAAGEISGETLKMLQEMEERMGIDYEGRCYAAERNRALRAKSAKNKQKKVRRCR